MGVVQAGLGGDISPQLQLVPRAAKAVKSYLMTIGLQIHIAVSTVQ